MSKQTKTSIREEFNNGFDLDNYGESHIVNRKVCDWWLSKFSQIITDMKEEMEKEKKSTKCDCTPHKNGLGEWHRPFCPCTLGNSEVNFNQGLSIGINLLEELEKELNGSHPT